MGYDSHAFLFYGREVEWIEYEVAENIHETTVGIIHTGNASSGKDERSFVYILPSYNSIMENRYEHVSAIFLDALPFHNIWVANINAYIMKHKLKSISDCGWVIGAWGS